MWPACDQCLTCQEVIGQEWVASPLSSTECRILLEELDLQHFFQGPELVVKTALWDLLSRVTVAMHAPVEDPNRYLAPSSFRDHAVITGLCVSI